MNMVIQISFCNLTFISNTDTAYTGLLASFHLVFNKVIIIIIFKQTHA